MLQDITTQACQFISNYITAWYINISGIKVTDSELSVQCGAMCVNPEFSIWGLNVSTTQHGVCQWFAYDETSDKCNLCFPNSNLPVMNLDDGTQYKVYSRSGMLFICVRIYGPRLTFYGCVQVLDYA